jgi:hypothetical protein
MVVSSRLVILACKDGFDSFPRAMAGPPLQ